MAVRVAISGFGRIGRLVLRAALETKNNDLEFVAINNVSDTETSLHLFKYDSIHGRFAGEATATDDAFTINGKTIKSLQEPDPSKIDWKDLGVDIVLECSGRFTHRDDAIKHLGPNGAKKVLISAPAKNEDICVVYGVNHKDLKAEHTVVSNASCTTNCLAPVAYVLNKEIGISRGFMTTIHSYTSDQRLQDAGHEDLHRARAAALSMIPTSTGAAKAVGKVLPELKGLLDGVSIRVPTPNVSLIDFKFNTKRSTTPEEIAKIMQEAADGELKGILHCYTDKLVSVDFNHNPHSANFALEETKVMDDDFVRVMAFYDNEWAFSLRMLDTVAAMHNVGYSS